MAEENTSQNTQTATPQATGAQSEPAAGAAPAESEKPSDKPEKTFTQKELDEIVKQKLDRAKKDMPTKDELKAYREWRDSQKTAEQKAADDIAAANSAKEAAEKEKQRLEIKVACLSKGVPAEAADDVIALASRLADENTTIEKAVEKVLEKYPAFKGAENKAPGITTGVRTGNFSDSSGAKANSLIETMRANQVKRK